uniref:Possible lipoprotein n=1 Tax=Rheinheimera sp. BAL341 TaxID=1708203 RepID=A0A486XTA0_9GAMM
MNTQFKRSKTARLIMMVPAAGLVLAGCGEKPVEVQVFNSPDECAAYYNPPAECKAAFAEAKALHPAVAPRYANKQECETDFGVGQCESAPVLAANSSEPAPQQSQASGGFFMPMMMGFMAGQMLNRGGMASAPQQQTASAARSPVATQPLYKSRDDRSTFRTATNTAVASQPGTTSIRPSAVQPKPAAMARRGGFGAQAAKRSTSSYGG